VLIDYRDAVTVRFVWRKRFVCEQRHRRRAESYAVALDLIPGQAAAVRIVRNTRPAQLDTVRETGEADALRIDAGGRGAVEGTDLYVRNVVAGGYAVAQGELAGQTISVPGRTTIRTKRHIFACTFLLRF
jgi:hypothetical protein